MTDSHTLYLSSQDVRLALPMSAAIETMRQAFAELSGGEVTLPTRACLQTSDQSGVDLVMPCYSATLDVFSLKTVTVFDDNPSHGWPRIQALLILTDGERGGHRAILEGTALTAIRTGAASGLATDLLARDDASVVAIFGAGVQARTQLEAVCCARDVHCARVFDPDQDAADRFAAEMTDRLGLPVESTATPSNTLVEADIICTATPSAQPVLEDGDVRAGVHINAVGVFRPEMAEIPAETVRRARVVVDHRAAALEEAGDLVGPLRRGVIQASHFSTELGEIVLGRAPGRNDDEEITLFKSVGVAIQDLYAAVKTLENARRMGLGTFLT